MQRLFLLLGVVALGFLTGCETVSGMREKFETREQPRTHVYNADQRSTYDAARRAAEQMGYRFVRGGPAQGELEAISGVATSDTINSSRQIALKAKFSGTADGTEISLVLREISEGDSARRAGQATATVLRDTPQYEIFFRTVQQGLDAPRKP